MQKKQSEMLQNHASLLTDPMFGKQMIFKEHGVCLTSDPILTILHRVH